MSMHDPSTGISFGDCIYLLPEFNALEISQQNLGRGWKVLKKNKVNLELRETFKSK